MSATQYIPATREALSEHLLKKKGTLTWKAFAEALRVPLVNVMWWRRHGFPNAKALAGLGLIPYFEATGNGTAIRPGNHTQKGSRFLPQNNSEAFAKFLTEMRGARTWTAFASELNVSRVTLSSWRAGRSMPGAYPLLETLGLMPCFRVVDPRPLLEGGALKPVSKEELAAENDYLKRRMKQLEKRVRRLEQDLREAR